MANQTTIKNTKVSIGDTIRVFYKIIEKEEKAGKTKKEVKQEIRERLQPYEGTVISIRGINQNQSFTVRRTGVDNVGIERIFPVISPWIEKISVKKHAKVKRAKLYYLRNLNKKAKIKTDQAEKLENDSLKKTR